MWKSFWYPYLQTYGHYGFLRRLDISFTSENIIAGYVRKFLQILFFHTNQDKKEG